MIPEERTVVWEADSREKVRDFPDPVKWTFGRALYKAQLGKGHRAASLMKGRLGGVIELAADEVGATYRLYYTLKCPQQVIVLYGHKKKSKKGIGIPGHEAAVIARRFRDAMNRCRKEKIG